MGEFNFYKNVRKVIWEEFNFYRNLSSKNVGFGSLFERFRPENNKKNIFFSRTSRTGNLIFTKFPRTCLGEFNFYKNLRILVWGNLQTGDLILTLRYSYNFQTDKTLGSGVSFIINCFSEPQLKMKELRDKKGSRNQTFLLVEHICSISSNIQYVR